MHLLCNDTKTCLLRFSLFVKTASASPKKICDSGTCMTTYLFLQAERCGQIQMFLALKHAQNFRGKERIPGRTT